MSIKFDVSNFDVTTYNRILDAGLSQGLGVRGKKVCIEAAICQVLGLPHGDDPGCVAPAVRGFKIALNDSGWPSPNARAEGLRKLGLAQLGSKGVVDNTEFALKIAEKTIRILIPRLFQEAFPQNSECLSTARLCEDQGTASAARSAEFAARSAEFAARSAEFAARSAEYAARSAESAAYAAAYAAQSAESAAYAAAYAARSAAESVSYLRLSADLALEILRELKSPGVALLGE